MRGKDLGYEFMYLSQRITPAYAGKRIVGLGKLSGK